MLLEVAQHTLDHVLQHYGSLALFALLATGIIGLPIPDETLLVLSGYFIATGKLSMAGTATSAIAGSISGITISYLLGYHVGHRIAEHFGKYIGLTQKKLDKAHIWFEKYGKYLLFFGYFIPGVRHVTGIIAGVTRLEFRQFALFAYLGAIVWVSFFLTAGYFFYHELHHYFHVSDMPH